MNFCQNCNNMYYVKLSKDNDSTLVYSCRKCGDENTNLSEDSICVSKTYFKSNEQNLESFVNKYTKYDPTLPRIYNMKCPNTECETNSEESEKVCVIISLRYDNINMKYLYICNECDYVWKN
jgi:DNA-directed RNA polymerase subunit M/transcription elongation factor TFIIS